MTVPVSTPRHATFKAGPYALLELIIASTLALTLFMSGAYMILEFASTWPGGVPMAIITALVQTLFALWILRRTWLNRQIQIDVLGLGPALIEHGMLISGRVRYRRKRWIAIDYETPNGQPMTLEYRSPNAFDLWQMNTVPILIDPRQPEDAFCPLCAQVEWLNNEDAEVVDRRPESLTQPTPASLEPVTQSMVLQQRSQPVQRSRLIRALDTIEGLIQERPPALVLEVTPERLTRRLEGTDTPDFDMQWSEPFTLHLSTRLIDAHRVELSVELNPLTDDATPPEIERTPLELRVELPMEAVSRAVPLKFSTAPWLDDDDFAVLWPLLLAHASLHSTEIDALLTAIALPVEVNHG